MKNFRLHLPWSFMVAVCLLSGCTDQPEPPHYIRLSEVICSLLGNGEDTKTITVDAVPEWKAVSSETWLKIVDETADSFTLTAEENLSGSERMAVVTVTAGEATSKIKVNQLSENLSIASYRNLQHFDMTAVISPSGKYAGGVSSEVHPDDSWTFYPTIIDLETGQTHVLDPVPETLYSLELPFCITDSGTMFVMDSKTGGCVAFSIDGDTFVPDRLEGYNWLPTVSAVSADGKYWAGYAVKEVGKYYPIKWIDGVPQELPMPDKNFRGEPPVAGILPRGMSADGSVIYGTSWDNTDNGMCYWKDNKFEWVGKDLHTVTPVTMINSMGEEFDTHIANGMCCTAELTNISPNGKWIAGTYRTEKLTEDRTNVIREKWPAFYNTETGITTVMTEYPENKGLAVTDEGIGFIGNGTAMIVDGFAVEIESGAHLGTTQQWIMDTYGIHVPIGTVSYVAPGNKAAMGIMMVSGATGASWKSWYVTAPRQ